MELIGVGKHAQGRRLPATALARTVADRLGMLDPGRVTELRDCIWAAMSPSLYETFVVKRGWTPKRYAHWLRATLEIPLAGLASS